MTTVKDTSQETKAPAAAKGAAKRKKAKRSLPHGQVHISATYNNTIVTVTDLSGGSVAATSAGACGFRGSKKGTAYAAGVAAETAVNAAKQANGLSKVDVFVKGVGQGRDAAIRSIVQAGVAITSITDKTGLPHGGCRPKKARRG